MAKINVLDKYTIDKIAAGEVVERSLNVVKELVENAIDASSRNITVEIKDGGTSLIRVTDDGEGIETDEIKKAFMSHATSKIYDADDLFKISTLGFRGEALSSIAAVSEVELITKTKEELLGTRYIIEGGKECDFEKIGAPNGTTFLVRNIFYNVPARKKFLKSNATEGSYISDLLEHIALSHPEIAFKFINNNKVIFSTSGNNNLKEVIYRIYGKETSDRVLDFTINNELISAKGYIGKPDTVRSTRGFETFFVNGRYVNCKLFSNAIEEGYGEYLMQHRFPFCIIQFSINSKDVDVNVHPSKMEIRLNNQDEIYKIIVEAVRSTFHNIELIPETRLVEDATQNEEIIRDKVLRRAPENFEVNRIKDLNINKVDEPIINEPVSDELIIDQPKLDIDLAIYKNMDIQAEQMSLFEDKFIARESVERYEILGQIFKTYWLIAFEDKLFMMDQHAAHEKVKYERLVKKLNNDTITTQNVNPPVVIELSSKEQAIIDDYADILSNIGYEIEDFGLGSIAIRAVPTELYGLNETELFKELIDELIENPLKGEKEVIRNKLASMACKAAVKGNMKLSINEVKALLDELLTLDNPYNCPHGRPTIVSLTKYEIEKKFKRVVN